VAAELERPVTSHQSPVSAGASANTGDGGDGSDGSDWGASAAVFSFSRSGREVVQTILGYATSLRSTYLSFGRSPDLAFSWQSLAKLGMAAWYVDHAGAQEGGGGGGAVLTVLPPDSRKSTLGPLLGPPPDGGPGPFINHTEKY